MRTPGSPIAEATRSVDQKSSARGSELTNLTLPALGCPGHAFEEEVMGFASPTGIAVGPVPSPDPPANP